MASEQVSEQLAQDIGRWLTDGLIDAPLHEKLRARYGAEQAGLAQLVRMLGIAGGALLAGGLLGLVAAATRSEGFGAVLLALVGGALLAAGLWLSHDALGRYRFSSKAVLTLGLLCVYGGVGLALSLLDVHDLPFTLGLIAVPLTLAFAYLTLTPVLLTLDVCGLFCWVASWKLDGDHQIAAALVAAAAVAIGVGIWHELALRDRTGRFYLVWETCGLIGVNLALLFLATDHDSPAWIAAFAGAGLAQLALGARLHNGLFTGFGVVALVVDFYVLFYQHFWHTISEGAFFLVGGALLLAAGAGFEWLQRTRRKGHA